MKKQNIKQNIVFILIALVSAGLLWTTTLLGEKEYYPLSDDKLQIVFLGDSNMANVVDGKTIPQRVAEQMECDVYNCAVGGTAAAKINSMNYFDYTADLYCLYNISKIIEIEEHQILMDFEESMPITEQMAIEKVEMLNQIEYEEIDYIVISYGVNDYTSGVPASSDDPYDELTYEGALRSAVKRIRDLCPNSTIIISSIAYCAYAGNENDMQDGYKCDWGGGCITDYRDAAERVASEHSNVIFMDNLQLLDIDASNYEQYLFDGIHFNADGQEMYADCLTNVIRENESNKDE